MHLRLSASSAYAHHTPRPNPTPSLDAVEADTLMPLFWQNPTFEISSGSVSGVCVFRVRLVEERAVWEAMASIVDSVRVSRFVGPFISLKSMFYLPLFSTTATPLQPAHCCLFFGLVSVYPALKRLEEVVGCR